MTEVRCITVEENCTDCKQLLALIMNSEKNQKFNKTQ